MINLNELNVVSLSNVEMIETEGGILIGLCILLFAAGVAAGLLL